MLPPPTIRYRRVKFNQSQVKENDDVWILQISHLFLKFKLHLGFFHDSSLLIWGKVFKNALSKICGRQALKNLN